MDTREKLYELLLQCGISLTEIEKRRHLEKDNMIRLYNQLLIFKEEEIQYLFNSLKDCEKLGTFICLRPFIFCLIKKGIPYWDSLKLILDDDYWKYNPFTINWLDMYYDLSEIERLKYIKMLLEANKDPLDGITKETDRVSSISQDYFDVYHAIGMLDTYKKEGISLYNSIQVQNYQVAYYVHKNSLSKEFSIKIINSLIEEMSKTMNEKELVKTFEFNNEKEILSYLNHNKERLEIYKSSLKYVKSKKYKA